MNHKITATQFYMLFFLCSIYYLSTISSHSLKDNFTDSLIAVFCSAAIGVVLSLPLLALHQKGVSMRQGIRKYFKGAATIVLALYGAYFVITDIITLSLMESLLAGTVFPTIPTLLIGVMAVIVGVYGAVKGIETVARSGLLVFVITILGCIAIVVGAIPLFQMNNRQVLLESGGQDATHNTLMIFARSSFLPQSVLLLSYVKGPVRMKCIGWSGGGAVLSATVLITLIHCLGGFGVTQLFPVYTLSSVSQLLPIQRMDIVFSAVWLMTLTLRLSCNLLAFKCCLKTAHSIRRGGVILCAAGAAVLVGAQLIKSYDLLGVVSGASIYLGIPVAVLGFGVPFYVWLKERAQPQKKGGEVYEKAL